MRSPNLLPKPQASPRRWIRQLPRRRCSRFRRSKMRRNAGVEAVVDAAVPRNVRLSPRPSKLRYLFPSRRVLQKLQAQKRQPPLQFALPRLALRAEQ